jgi:hypothetical protein
MEMGIMIISVLTIRPITHAVYSPLKYLTDGAKLYIVLGRMNPLHGTESLKEKQ